MPKAHPLLCALLLGLFALGAASPALAAKKKPTPKPAAPAGPAVCEDFYGNVNFSWLQAHPLPAGASSFSRWDELNALAEQQSRELLGRSSAAAPGQASALLANLVASAGNGAGLDAGVRATAQPLLAQIDSIRKPRDIARVAAALHAAGVPVIFGFDALRDAATGQPRIWLLPGGLGMPEPGYYDSAAPELQRAVALYRSQQLELLKFAGLAPEQAQKQAELAYSTELALARAMGPVGSDAGSAEQLAKKYPSLRLVEFLQAQGVSPPLLNVQQPAWFAALDAMWAKPNIAQWQAYLRVHLLQALAPAMARDPRNAWLAALAIAGPSALPTAAERLLALSRTDAAELLSSAYAESFLSAADAQRAQVIAEAIRAALGRAIDRAGWLSPAGKAASRSKLAAIQLMIGKPVEASSFADLHFDRGNYAGNLLALQRWNRARALARMESAVWPAPVSQASPAIGYQPAQNRLVITAAALHVPAFEPRSVAAEFGGFGALIAQQMSLAFADYTETDGRELAGRQQPLVAQYNAYSAGTGTVNGMRMLRQDAADLAAIEISWDAFQAQGPADTLANKEFFRAWAAVWARQDNPQALAAAQLQSAFAPARWRVNGPLSNTPAFLSAYACKAGQRMHRAAPDQAAIWR
ncbi:MAG: M13 family metallopeptidase [Arenimonas sp.]